MTVLSVILVMVAHFLQTLQSGNTSIKTFPEVEHLSLSCEQLIAEQRNYAILSPLFKAAVTGDKIEFLSTGYFVNDGLLMRNWTPLNASVADDWSVVTVFVIPGPY